jgi:hypothetical protein
MKLYRSYMFRSKDPVIDQLRTAIQDKLGRQFDYGDLKAIEDDGGPTAGAMGSWFWGKTRRPQNSSIEAAGRSMGMMRVWVPLKLEEPKMPKVRKTKKAKG